MKKDADKKIIEEKVQDFEKNILVLKKKGHGETNIRTSYIDVLFEALGWNLKSHYDVVREFSPRDTSGKKKVDYAFKINGKLKFFVEAKEASIDLVNDKDSIYQAKRYVYSTGVLELSAKEVNIQNPEDILKDPYAQLVKSL